MKWLKRILISLAILVLVGFGGFIVYVAAYSEGEAAGYDNGYSVGQEAGYDLGKQDGYDEGYVLGKQDGYNEGYDLGKEDGYEEGAQAGLGHGYTLRDPTYKEVVTFLKQDKTDENKFVEDTYVCSHFARDVGNNADDQGLRCAFVEMRYPEQGHTIIAFNTIDKGLVYFEPQIDGRVEPVIGKSYYECVEPKPGYYYEEPLYDDTIMDILVIW